MSAQVVGRCSWCLAKTAHSWKDKALLGRDTYQCDSCKKRTLPCNLCMTAGRRSGAGGSGGSFSHSGSGSFKLSRSGSAGDLEAPVEQAMARDGTVWSDGQCLVCNGIIGCWPSSMDDDQNMQRTGSALSGASNSMRGTTTLSHTQSTAAAPTAERRDISAPDIQQLQLALLKAQRSMLVRVDNQTPYNIHLIDDATQIEHDGLAGGNWCLERQPPSVIMPNQAVAFGTVSKGMNMGGTAARVGYEIRDDATLQRVAVVQLRWVNPLVNGDKKNWCETRTDYVSELGPKIIRRAPTPNDHSTVSFVIHWGEGGADHFNPDLQANRDGVLRPMEVQDVARATTPDGRGSHKELHDQKAAPDQLPEISVWENARRPPLVGDFSGTLLVVGVDPPPWSDANSDGEYAGLDDPTLLPFDCKWCEEAGWHPMDWEYAVSFSTTFPRSLYSSFSARKGIADMVRRREWRRPCIPQVSNHEKLAATLQAKLMEASERSILVTIHNGTQFPMVLESAKVDWGSCVPGGQPRSLIPASTSATIALQATTRMTGVEGSLTYSVKPTTSTGPSTLVYLRYINPKIQSELGVWCETKTTGADAAPRLAIKRSNPTQSEHSVCEFIVEENPTAPSPNTHYNPAEGLDTGIGVASATAGGMASVAATGNDGLRLFLRKSPRSTLVTFTNLSSQKLKLSCAEVHGGSWAKSRKPPELIDPNSVVSFGAASSTISMADLKIRVVYHSEVSQGEWHGVSFDQQAGFSIRCKNPSPARLLTSRKCTVKKYLLGDDTMGVKVAKQQDTVAEQGDNNEWSFLITDGEDPYTIYAARKQDLTVRLRAVERSMIVSIANRCGVPLILQGDALGCNSVPISGTWLGAGTWIEPPPKRINPGQTAMMALKPQMLELGGIRASVRYILVDVAHLKTVSSKDDDLVSFGSATLEFSNSSGTDSKKSYRSISSGDVFCERLVDPHDVDQLMEKDDHACATFVVEQATVTTVNIGTSVENTKTVAVEGVLAAEPVAINRDAEGKPDVFDVRVEQSSGSIVVQRIDAPSGWSHDLTIRVRMDLSVLEVEVDDADRQVVGQYIRKQNSTTAGGTVSGFVQIGSTNWVRRGMLFSKERETETNVEWLKDELSLDKDWHTDMALRAACDKLRVPYQAGASSLKLSRDCTQAILRNVQAQQRPGIFMSHAQANGGPQVRALKPRLQEECPALQGVWEDRPDGENEKIWLDVDEKPDQSGMKNGIRRQSCFLIFLTKGYLTRRFCQYEIHWALRYEKTIVLVYETNTEYGHASFADYIAECPMDLKVIFEKSVAVPYYSDDVFGRLSRAEIIAQCGLSTTQHSEVASHALHGTPEGRVLIVANDHDSTARAQAENLRQQLLNASPTVQLELLGSTGYKPTHSKQLKEHFLIFLTNHVFQQPAVCGILRAAVRNPSNGNIIFVAEADMRYNAVGIPLMGGPIAQELRDQVPLTYRQELQPLLDVARPIPFYPVRLFRDESIAQILAALCQPTLLRGSDSDTRTDADLETRPDVLALIHRLEQEKEVALAEKDSDMQRLAAAHMEELRRKEMELVALRDELALGMVVWEFHHNAYVSATGDQTSPAATPGTRQQVWQAYTPHQRDVLECAYRHDPAGSCDITNVTCGQQTFSYRVDFAKWYQQNLSTGRRRGVRRRIVAEEAFVEQEPEPEPELDTATEEGVPPSPPR